MIIHQRTDLPAAVVVVRPDDGEVLVVVNPATPNATVRHLSAMLLHQRERRQLSRAIARQ